MTAVIEQSLQAADAEVLLFLTKSRERTASVQCAFKIGLGKLASLAVALLQGTQLLASQIRLKVSQGLTRDLSLTARTKLARADSGTSKVGQHILANVSLLQTTHLIHHTRGVGVHVVGNHIRHRRGTSFAQQLRRGTHRASAREGHIGGHRQRLLLQWREASNTALSDRILSKVCNVLEVVRVELWCGLLLFGGFR